MYRPARVARRRRAAMTYELPPNPLGGLASDIDLAVAVAGDEPARRRLAVALPRDGLNVTAEAGAPDELAMACGDGVPHVAVLARSACRPHTAAAVRVTRRQLPRTRVVVVADEDRSDDVRGAVDSGADAVVVESRLPATLSVTVRAVCAGPACLPRAPRLRGPALPPARAAPPVRPPRALRTRAPGGRDGGRRLHQRRDRRPA